MDNNTFEPSSRKENIIDKKKVEIPNDFDIDEIKKRFDEDVDYIKNCETLLRAQKGKKNGNFILFSKIVFIESAFDFYLHEISKYGITKILRKEWQANENRIKFNISLKALLEYMDETNYEEMFRAILNSEWSKAVFIDFEVFTDQINLIGIDKKELMKKSFPNEKDPGNYGKDFLIDLYKKRNHVVHQLMRKHIDAKREVLTKEYVNSAIDGVNSIANAIYDIIKNKVN